MPLLRGHAATHGKLALVHFDAHTDSYAQHQKYDHGSMFYRAPREGLIDTERSVQIGIRTDYDRESHEFQVINAEQANAQAAQEIITNMVESSRERATWPLSLASCRRLAVGSWVRS